MNEYDRSDVIGVLLAGGQSRRMGQNKALMLLGGRPLICHVIDRMRPQVADIIINANGDPAPYHSLGLPVVADILDGFAGPLAGVLTGMTWTRAHHPSARYIVTAACDTPFFPPTLAASLFAATNGRHPGISLATSGGQMHPVFGLWPVSLADTLRDALDSGARKVVDWADSHGAGRAMFAPVFLPGGEADPFFNVNTPDDLRAAERLLGARED